ncbi:MAG: hypothetical protein E6P95_03700 [Candidatus Moraniibacteriota bacterium]|nr:MAG: hypothetical protein E6P95_03700 [Candidatus Moranbacteria bacterium]
MQIITLSGIDGSGKSTQLARLRTYLESKGAKVAYIHAIAFSLPQAARTLFARRGNASSGMAVTKSSWIGVLLRKIILCIDLVRFRLLLHSLRQTKTDYLLSDRYFYDTLINIAYLDGTRLDTPFARLAARCIPRPDLAFYLDVSPEFIMRRPRKPEQGLQYLKDKSILFREAATNWGFLTLDANQPIESVSQAIQKQLTL